MFLSNKALLYHVLVMGLYLKKETKQAQLHRGSHLSHGRLLKLLLV